MLKLGGIQEFDNFLESIKLQSPNDHSMIGFVSSWDRWLKSGFWDSESFQTFDGLKVFGEDKTMDSLRLFEIIRG